MMVQLQTQTKRFGTDVRDGWATKVDFQEIFIKYDKWKQEDTLRKYNYFNQTTALRLSGTTFGTTLFKMGGGVSACYLRWLFSIKIK
jgi:thioredoxin reductase (NADPH)